MKETITLQDILKIVRENFLFIISFTLLRRWLQPLLVSFVLKPTYEAETQILVNQKI